MKKLILWITMSILLINIVSSLGISPAKSEFDFITGHTVQSSLDIINNENKS